MKQQLLPSMSEDIEAALKRLSESAGESRCSIFRVSQAVAGGIAEACRPRMVSIGQYHHGESELEMFQGHKWRYLPSMLGRTQSHGICLEKLINVVAPKEKIIRQCYSESIDNFNGSDLVKMMVLDGCFIIEFFRELSKLIPYLDSPLIYNTYVKAFVMQDILRLENQVPYFVLHVLFETTNVPEGTSSLADLSFNFFSCFLKVKGLRLERRIHLRGVHLLNLFRLSLIPSDQQDNQVHQYSSFHMIRSASKLCRVGIRFKQREASTFLEIKFDKKHRTIGIPKIAVDDDDLNWILPNMIAFEQCRGQKDNHVTAYAMFMGSLIRTVDDVQLLRNYKVISNHGMSNEDLARFFGNIRKAAPSDVKGSYLASEHIMHLRLA
ncbi:hypothetical protein BT93_L0613 [Corymbia citriodora subsp. variegata]|uniref:Uncharacterized protein n=1 Tax=Corymbia citriodora subsp. variegata TaxID=360336 RepID=A0A8T0CTV8_CORYI|nr:hypothetical protein BT93_L0613 [Corymbia citriodora subsp. variegata]